MVGRLKPPNYVVVEEKSLVKRFLEKVARTLPVALVGLVGVVLATLSGGLEDRVESLLREVYNWVIIAVLVESAIEATAEHFINRKLESYVESTSTGFLARALNLPIKEEVLEHLNPVYWAVHGRAVLVEEAGGFYTAITIDLAPIGITVVVYRAKPDSVVYEPLEKFRGVILKRVREEERKSSVKYSKGRFPIHREFTRTIRGESYIEKTLLGELELPSPSNPYTLVKCRGPVVSATRSVFHVVSNPVKLEKELSKVVSRTLDEVVKAFDELMSGVKNESKVGREKRV